MSYSVRFELCHLVFVANCVIYCPVRIVSFSVRIVSLSVRIVSFTVRIISFSVRFELRHLVSGSNFCHLVSGSNCAI